MLISGEFPDDSVGVLRLNADGSVDPSFQTMIEDTTGEDDPDVSAFALQADGRVLINGSFNLVNGQPHRNVARLFTESRNCPGFVSFSAQVYYADESAGHALVTLQRTAGASGALTVAYATTNREAVAGADYTASEGLVTFADGETQRTLSVPLQNDTLREANERFAVVLSAPNNGWPIRAGTRLERNVVILDDETAGRPGNVDGTFAAALAPSYYGSLVRDLALQPDGRIVLCGIFNLPNATLFDGVARLLPNGAADYSFNAAASSWPAVFSVAVQPDGKILAGGAFKAWGDVPRLRLARLLPDGSLDASFAPQVGRAEIFGYEVMDILVQPDGKLLIGGIFDTVNGFPRQSIARLHADGSLDTSFGAGPDPGVTRPDDVGWVYEMALQPDGKILVAGLFTRANGVPRNGLARLNPDGSLDAAFNPQFPTNEAVHTVAVQSDGKVVVGGEFNCWGTNCQVVARFMPDGSLDAAFQPPTNAVGISYGRLPEVKSLALQPDGKIVIAGIFSRIAGASRNGIARLNSDGSLDEEFFPGAGLLLRSPNWGNDGWAEKVLLQPDGQTLVGGGFTEVNFLPHVGLARLHGDHPPLRLPFVRREVARPTVQLVAAPPAGVSVYAVEDQVLPSAVVANISHGGVFDPVTGKVKFGPFYDAEPRTLSYGIVMPPGCLYGVCALYSFTGTASVDGVNTPIMGDAQMLVAGLHPADLPPADSQLAINEVTAYGAAWRRGQTWPVPPNPIPIDYVTRAGMLWRQGECYAVDRAATNAPSCWVPCHGEMGVPLVPGEQAGGLSYAERDAPPFFIPGEPLTVTLAAAPAAEASAFAVEDQVPAGWTVTGISDGGELDTVNSKVKWGPFLDPNPRTLSYQAAPPDSAGGVAVFTGAASFDGASITVTGTRQIRAGSRLRVALEPGTGRLVLNLVGLVDGRYLIETSTDLARWLPLTEVTASPDGTVFPLNNRPEEPQRFYRAKLLP
jgi:uncharacterized delta-60 repeat protein